MTPRRRICEDVDMARCIPPDEQGRRRSLTEQLLEEPRESSTASADFRYERDDSRGLTR